MTYNGNAAVADRLRAKIIHHCATVRRAGVSASIGCMGRYGSSQRAEKGRRLLRLVINVNTPWARRSTVMNVKFNIRSRPYRARLILNAAMRPSATSFSV